MRWKVCPRSLRSARPLIAESSHAAYRFTVSLTTKAPSLNEPSRSQNASILEVAKAIFWSFLGIRKRQHHDQDMVKITPVQVVIGGLIGAAIFIATLVTVVHIVLSK